MRSLVPMVKKSTSRASSDAVKAADGTSIMMPTGTRRRLDAAQASSPRASSSSALAARTSCSDDTNGNMMRSGPCVAARSSARSCVLNWPAAPGRTGCRAGRHGCSRSCSANQRVERGIDQRPIQLALVDVERADGHRSARHPFDQLAIDVILLVLGGHVGRTADQHELRAVQADALGARIEGSGHVLGPLDVGVQRDAHAVPRLDRAVAVATSCDRRLPLARAAPRPVGSAAWDRRSLAGLAVDDHRHAGRHAHD